MLSEPLSGHTTYKVGGKAECLVSPECSDEAINIFRFARKSGIPITLLGAGSNVIAPDDGIEGLVLKVRNRSALISFPGDCRILADAGVTLIDLARWAGKKGYEGFEPIAGIPGTVGGAVLMNAGTKEGDTAGVLEKVEVLTASGERRVFKRGELSFGYRESTFQGSGWLILRAQFKLRRGDPSVIIRRLDEIWEQRQRKFPLDYPNAGSVFKRPPGDYAGRLIEESGCKGMRIGAAAISERHANFIINLGGASAADITALISAVRRRVFEKTGIYLELEQQML